MDEPLAVQVLSRSAVSMLIQVLKEDSSAVVTEVDIAPLPSDDFENRRERVRVSWNSQGENGEYSFILQAFGESTWSQRINPDLPTPAPVLFVESDLPAALTMVNEGFVASGRKRISRPAWVLREDWSEIETIAHVGGATQEMVHSGSVSPPAFLARLLDRTAAIHALHWGADRVLDDVYPWLPRFSDWITRDPEVRERGSRLLREMAQMPQSIIHGTWSAHNLRWRDGELLVEGWDRVMVGPAAWDLFCLLDSLGVKSADTWVHYYGQALSKRVPEFDQIEALRDIVTQLLTH